MNKFETKLLQEGSLELICSYVEVHKEIVSSEFRNALIEKITRALQSSDFKLSCFIFPTNDDVLGMNIKDFLDRFNTAWNRQFPKLLFDWCQEQNIKTAMDLLKKGRHQVLQVNGIGQKTVNQIGDAFETAGIHSF